MCSQWKIYVFLDAWSTVCSVWQVKSCVYKTCNNKKVLLHERKRHTAHHISRTRYAVPRGGGLKIQSWMRGNPSRSWPGGTPVPGGVPPSQDRDGVPPPTPPCQDRDGVCHPQKGHWTSGSIMGWRYYVMDMGYIPPPPPPHPWTERHLWKQYLPHPSDAGGNNSCRSKDKLANEAK